ncbi:energy-coupling factor ABC transporter permease [Planctobacterium marinum]|uniref:energy-coupling factor ABC transporter permease n=1 Tax=Planctobacterium marinum TaxID=1631968 RepID=UPI001E5559EE|nr:energy-coupling factor ABC transporter permease [Planctobacterium marinum]MCC2604553.1 energy-coupling factor ABC transporter permease [Planctobacterium marinum]
MTLIQVIALVAWLALLVFTLKNVNISRLISERKVQHFVFGSAACLFTLWWFRTGIYDGLNVHFLWLTACVLLLGLRWALISSSLALLGLTLVGLEKWSMLGVNGLLSVVAPLTLSYAIYSLAFHRLPKHFFIYVFVCGFFAGLASLVLKMGLLGGYYSLAGVHSWDIVQDNYLILIPLLLFPEGLLNGMTMTLLIIYKPHWVYTFHDKFYIDGK